MNALPAQKKLKIAIVGTGISGMSASWLLSMNHDVTIFEKDDRIGG
ncbi:MAG: NAD(P)-binding protein, partial [Methylocystaceae bacterium]|nr:NAD(P)-binding protein [Methylocystaceae bacterium]